MTDILDRMLDDIGGPKLPPIPQGPSPFIPGTKLQWIWDSTSLGWFKKCPRYYEYAMVRGYKSRGNTHLYFGIEFHQAMHDFELAKIEGMSFDEAQLETIAKLLCRTYNFESEITTKTRETLVRSVIWYLEQYKDDPAKTIILANGQPAIELAFKFSTNIEIRGNFQFEEKTYMLAGHLDRLCSFANSNYVMDRKTTDKTVGTYYFANYSPDNQMSCYTASGQIVYDIPLNGVLIDAIQTAVGFTRCERGIAARTPEHIDEWMHDLEYWLRMAEAFAKAEYWPMNDRACIGCTYKDVCAKSPSARDTFLQSNFEVDRWNPLTKR